MVMAAGLQHLGRPSLLLQGLICSLLILQTTSWDGMITKAQICIGTNGRMSVPSNREHHYRNLKDRFTNCTYVDGNLELTWLNDERLDLSFLKDIKEVTGYVLISQVDVKSIVLPKLQIIRGRTLFKLNKPPTPTSFSLFVSINKMHSLEMPALRDILAGDAGFFDNYNLCHMKSIDWKEILSGEGARFHYYYNFTTPERECLPCDPSCTKGCWGQEKKNCQVFSKVTCSPQCHQGRCFGPEPRDCCHLFCAGGCTGPKQSDCLACQHFNDDGNCTMECPSMQRYNSITYSWETNPNGKYAYGATCVKNCPAHLLKDNGACVRSCPSDKKAVNQECVPCDGPCPKTCKTGETFIVHSGNIDTIKDCTVIDGSITILDQTFTGFQQFKDQKFGERHAPMSPERLEVFSTIKEITGHINVQGSHPNFTNLKFFRNLEVIGGRHTTEFYSSLFIVRSTLTSLGLRSLKNIQSGAVTIIENNHLCYADKINWDVIKRAKEQPATVQSNKLEDLCKAEGRVCDAQCSDSGCWGPGPDQCISCKNYRFNDTCLGDCTKGMYKSGSKMCYPCDPECSSVCYGSGPGNCSRCLHVRDGPFCVKECPANKYSNIGDCKPCHENCVEGCLGPDNTIGPSGCKSCDKAVINGDFTVERCLRRDEQCPDGYYYEYVGPQEQGPLKPLAGKMICRKCHPRCKKCTGYGFHEQVCQECKDFKKGEQCEDECPQDHYADDITLQCIPCFSECKGCRGPDASHCLDCRNFRIYEGGINPLKESENTTAFNCTETCPPDIIHKNFPDNGKPYCSIMPNPVIQKEASRNNAIAISVVVIAVVVSVCGVVIIYYCRLRIKAKESVAKVMSLSMQGLEPLRPTNTKPNLAQLRIVKEAEMRKGGVLGYGAFGTVYKGVWVPEGENVKIPVAIKVLRERTGANTSKEFLEEAYIMASVEHPNLLKLLGVCMTSQMMLVTQLMPLGCLLDYVKNNKHLIGSKPLLNWCTQIAKGMAYLEDKRLVHRDLAARNVLVQTPNLVKITDFGLAKLLDINEDEYRANGGKMPIKWLALECIQHRIFTHKSDVWAFGVTVWELLTYGGRPYEHVPAREVPDLLEKGERLPQPNICAIEVYMLMIKCWMLDPESRPTFKELADEFAKMARDPGRYLAIQGDTFMRLPSYSSQDEKEQTSLEIAEGGDNEEYLQPKCRAGMVSPSPQPESPLPPNQSTWDHKYPTQPRRYCSDPVGMKEAEAAEEGHIAAKRGAQVGDLKLDLPVDEDDYLMPSPQQSQATTAYMDLIGDAKPCGDFPDGLRQNYPDFLQSAGQLVDNPEYHLFPGQTLGIPMVNGHPSLPHQKSSEEESDHEYYNDFDRHRELQPLRRSETTV